MKGNDIAIAKPVLEKKYFSIRDRYLKRKILNTLVKFTEKGKKDESYKIFMGAFNSSEYFFPGIKGLERILGKKEVLLLLFDKLQNTSAGSKHVGSIVCAIDNYLWTMEGCCPPLKGYSKNPKRAWIEWWDKNKDRVIAETKKQWWQF